MNKTHQLTSKTRQRIVDVLLVAKTPLPTDQIRHLSGVEHPEKYLFEMSRRHLYAVTCRRCPDDGNYNEWWLTYREDELIFLPDGKK